MNRIKVTGNFRGTIQQRNYFWGFAVGLTATALIICVTILVYKFANRSNPDYSVTRASGIVHNRICTHYGKSQGFYLDLPGGYRNCKICGGATIKKRKEAQK